MDGTLFDKSRSFQNAWDTTRRCIDAVSVNGGILVVNCHTNSFNCPFKREWEKMYEKILEYCGQQGAWLTSAEEIIKFWQGSICR